MSRAAALRGGLALALAVGSGAGAIDLLLHRFHPALAFGRSSALGVVALYVLPALFLAAAVALLWPRQARRLLVAILPALAVLVVGGGAINILWLPSLLSPSSIFFDAFMLVFVSAVAYRLHRARRRPRAAPSAAVGILLLAVATALSWWPASSGSAGGGAAADAEREDIVVILLDALRADHCSAYGYERETTPNIDALASEGILFENAYAPSSWTKPCVASLFTGVHPASHGNHLISSKLPDALPTLGEWMDLAGYETAIFAENAFVSPLFGYGRGIDHVLANEPDVPAQSIAGHMLQQLVVRRQELEPLLEFARLSNRLDPRQRFKTSGGFDVVESFGRWLGGRGDEALFAYVHLMKPHAPYSCPAPFDGAFGEPSPAGGDSPLTPPHVEGIGPFATTEPWTAERRDRLMANYDERLLYGDSMVGEILAALRESGRYDRANIFIVADHGEEFGENGLYDHGHSLQEGVLRVPFVVKPAGGRAAPSRRTEVVQLLDLPATLLPLAGIELPAHFAGRDLFWQMREQTLQSESVYAQLRHGPGYEMESWLSGQEKFVSTVSDKGSSQQLFDLASDPGESNPLGVAAHDALWETRLAEAREAAGRHRQAEADVVLDAETLEHLRALGYVE